MRGKERVGAGGGWGVKERGESKKGTKGGI